MFGKITYNNTIGEYESIYSAKDVRTARWIAERYEKLCTEETTIFSYDTYVVVNSKSEKIVASLCRQLNEELKEVMAGQKEIDAQYSFPVKFSLK